MNKTKLIEKELLKTLGCNHYNGWNNRTNFGYHSYNIGDISVVGQRNPSYRIRSLKDHLSFENKIVFDFGCNVGAMLHHLPEIKLGVGFDYDINCINAGNNISKILQIEDKINLYNHDFDKNPYELLEQKIIKHDISFLLSLGSWVRTWRQLYSIALNFSDKIVLEINNENEGKPQLDFFIEKGCKIKMLINNSLDDSTGNNLRKTYLIY